MSMAVHTDNQHDPFQMSSAVKVIVLSIFAVALSVVAVSFAAHHMRIGFEGEYADIHSQKMMNLANTAAFIIDGDEIVTDPITAGEKYSAIFDLIFLETSDNDFTQKYYGLYAFSGDYLTIMFERDSENLITRNTYISKWLTNELKPYEEKSNDGISIIIPITDSQGNVVAVFELTGRYTALSEFGDNLEIKILLAVMIAVAMGMILFSTQYVVPRIVSLMGRRDETV
jgi:hypothetical protein